MSTNYLAVIACLHCGEMIRTMPDSSIICACTTKRSCKHPEGMDDCHECTIARLQERVDNQEPWLAALGRMLVQHRIARFPDDVLAWRTDRDHYKALAERRKEALEEYGRHGLGCTYGLLPAGVHRQGFSEKENARLRRTAIKECTCGFRAAIEEEK